MNKLTEPVAGRDIDFNREFALAYDFLENTMRNVFITGKAGTGKSTLLEYFRNHTPKKVAVLAPTGVAAVNIKGQTIHSFFRFKPDVTPDSVRNIKLRRAQKKLYEHLDTVIIDEVSMVRSDLLDCIDLFLQRHGPRKMIPFGGVQMVLIGDLFQLPPVVTESEQGLFEDIYASPYFFDSKIYGELNNGENHPHRIETIELKKIYRQKEEDFVRLLGAIRDRTITAEHLKVLNQRFIPQFQPDQSDHYIYLTTTNVMADRVNRARLEALPVDSYSYEGIVTGDFESKTLPTQQTLELKVGAQVMLLNNDREGRWVNGTIGKIVDVKERPGAPDAVGVELADGGEVEVTPFTWEMFRFFYNEETAALDSETVGSFTQYPLRLAWAVTIHKSQGKTFPKIIVDIGRGTFSHGQVYVALSRCTSLAGLVLKKPILKRHILMDWRIVEFMTNWQCLRAEGQFPLEERKKILERAIENERPVDIVYLKANDEKTRRTIGPRAVGEMEYLGKTYLGVEAYCFARKEVRAFRLDRILEIKEVAH